MDGILVNFFDIFLAVGLFTTVFFEGGVGVAEEGSTLTRFLQRSSPSSFPGF